LASQGAQFAVEYAERKKKMRDFLEPKLPLGVKLLQSHRRYSPDNFDPNIVAIHIHARKLVEDLDEVKLVTEGLARAIRPREIETAIR